MIGGQYWLLVFLGLAALSDAGFAQTVIKRIESNTTTSNFPRSSSNFELRTDASKWVVDIGSCAPNQACLTNGAFAGVGGTIGAQITSSDVIRQVDIATGSGHSLSEGLWDLAPYSGFNFSFRDQNGPGLFHYVLMYSSSGCYRQWLFNHPFFNGGHSLEKDQWYSISAGFGNNQWTDYYTQDGPSVSCAVASNFDFGTISYFEVGIFGENVELNSEYRFETSSTIVFFGSAAGIPEPLTWTQLLVGFFFMGVAFRRRASLGDARASSARKMLFHPR